MNIVDRIISPNIWDEVWELGSIDGTTGQNTIDPNLIRSKNYIKVTPNSSIYIYEGSGDYLRFRYYDKDKNYIGALDAQGQGSGKNVIRYMPSNCEYMRFTTEYSYGTTYNHNICINKSNPSINGKYFPYVMYKRYDMVDKPIYELPEGYIPTDIEVGGSYGVVDLKTLNWNAGQFGYSNGWYANLADIKTIVYAETPKMLSTNYTPVASIGQNLTIGKITVNAGMTRIWVGREADNLTNKPTGYLIYERSTPASPTLVRGNELNKYCIYNEQIGVYGDTFKYNSNIPLRKWLRRLKIGG